VADVAVDWLDFENRPGSECQTRQVLQWALELAMCHPKAAFAGSIDYALRSEISRQHSIFDVPSLDRPPAAVRSICI